MESLESQFKQLQEDNDRLNHNTRNINGELSDRRSRLDQLTKELERLQDQNNDLKLHIEKCNLENSSLRSQIKSQQEEMMSQRTAFTIEVSSIERAIESALAGIQPKSESEIPVASSALESIKSYVSLEYYCRMLTTKDHSCKIKSYRDIQGAF
jgi:chromosome segregation ATPase